jgi:hypothetical protein
MYGDEHPALMAVLCEQWSFTKDFLMIARANKKLQSSVNVLILYFFFMVTGFTLMQFSVYPEFVYLDRLNYFRMTCQVLFGLSLFLNVVVAFSDPGFLTRDETLVFSELLEEFDCTSLCSVCKIIKAPRTKHCDLCSRCVDRFDHHCPWINSCVGRGNVKRFYSFVVVQMTYLVCATIACFINLKMQFFNE